MKERIENRNAPSLPPLAQSLLLAHMLHTFSVKFYPLPHKCLPIGSVPETDGRDLLLAGLQRGLPEAAYDTGDVEQEEYEDEGSEQE